MTETARSVLIIEARFYEDIADELARGAIAALEAQGVSYERLSVPGALEIPVAFSLAISSGVVGTGAKHQGCVALGCVIRGETSHYDIVARESARALLDLASAHAIPVGNGILTVDTRDQAWARARAGSEDRNKGRHAAGACLALMDHQASLAAGKSS